MIAWWWSWLLAAVGITGLWYAGNHRKTGWVIGACVQLLWIAYALASGQLGFLVSALAYGGMNIRNLLKWKREQASDEFRGCRLVPPGDHSPLQTKIRGQEGPR